MYKNPFPCPFHSCYRYIPFTEAIFLPFCLIFFYTTEKTKTAIDYLDNPANQQARRSSEGLLLVSMEHRRVRSSPNATPQQSQAFPLSIHSTALERHLSMILLTTRGKTGRNPTSSPTLNHLPSPTEAQHCTANGKAGHSTSARSPA